MIEKQPSRESRHHFSPLLCAHVPPIHGTNGKGDWPGESSRARPARFARLPRGPARCTQGTRGPGERDALKVRPGDHVGAEDDGSPGHDRGIAP